MDLLDIGTGWPWRRLPVLIAHLPLDSATQRALADEPADVEWTTTNLLQAEVVDLTRLLIWMQADPKKRGKRPTPIERPGRRSKPKRPRQSQAEMFARLRDHRERMARR